MIHNPAGLYGGGAFKFDMQPAINYVLKKQAQEEATKKALEKQFEKSMANQTPTGMRGIDADAYSLATNNVKDFWINNKNKLLNGDVKTTIEFERMSKIPLQIAAESKQYNEDAKDYERISKTNPDIANLYTDETLGIDKTTGQPLIDPADNGYMGYYGHNQPSYIQDENGQVVKNPKFKRFDISKIAFKPKPIAPDEFNKMIETVIGPDVKPIETSLGIVKDPKNKNYQREDVEIGYADNDIKNMGDKMVQFAKDPRVKQYIHDNYPYQTFVDQNAEQFSKANETFKKYYGRDIAPGNENELFAGIVMAQKGGKKVQQGKLQLSPEAKQAMDFAYAKKLEQWKKSLTPNLATQIAQVKTGFEMIPDGQYGKVTIRGGYAYGADGKPYNSNGFDVKVPKDKIPTDVLNKRAQGTNINLIDDMDLNIVNGVIQAAKNEDAGLITRGTLLQDQLQKMGIKNTGAILLNSSDAQTLKVQKKNVPSGSKQKLGNLGF